MSKFYDDGVTIIAILTIFVGLISMLIKICYKSKCSNINICYGLLNIKRTVEIETDTDKDIIPNQSV